MKDSEKRENLTIGVVGLGLIGGSMAKAYKQAGHAVYGYDASETVTKFAILSGTLDGALAREEYARCNLLFVATYPEAAARFLQENAPYFSKHGIVMDLCGTKEMVCRAGFAAARASSTACCMLSACWMGRAASSKPSHSRTAFSIRGPVAPISTRFLTWAMTSGASGSYGMCLS